MPANKNNYKSISLHKITYALIQNLGPKMELSPGSSVPRIISILAETKDGEIDYFWRMMNEKIK
tara:strand:- start:206 stop:397 length:192 start_codon:yes stop_codon:yes gene_type:complete